MGFSQSTSFPYKTLVSGETVSMSVTIKTGQGVIRRGQILGKEVASGKYTLVDAPSVILVEDVDTTAADVLAPVYKQGRFKANVVILQAAQTIAQARDALQDFGIYLETVEETTGLIIRTVGPAEAQFLKEKEEDRTPPAEPAPGFTGPIVPVPPLQVGQIVEKHADKGYKVLEGPLGPNDLDDEDKPDNKRVTPPSGHTQAPKPQQMGKKGD